MTKKGALIVMCAGVGLTLPCILVGMFSGSVALLFWLLSLGAIFVGAITLFRIPAPAVIATGGACFTFSFIFVFIFPSSWDDVALVFGFLLLFFGGIALIIYGILLIKVRRKQRYAEWEELYSDPQWREDNPRKAAAVEKNRHREHMRWYGPAVKIHNLQPGYMDNSGIWFVTANYAGGWSVRYKIANIGARTIKYVTITLAAYNAVGDKCYCRTQRWTDVRCRFTGPLYQGRTTDWLQNDNLWYDIAMCRPAVEHIHVDFMDGSSQDIYKDGTVENHGF